MTEERPLRFGVIGAGWFASRRHIPDILKHPEAELVALIRRDESELQRLRDHFGPVETYTGWEEMLRRTELDAVVIATPHNLHYAPARAAMERGLHVVLEKPMTVDPAEAWDLCRIAKERGVQLAVALNPPYWAHCHGIRRAIQGGAIGDVESISFYWTGNALPLFGEAPRPADMPGIVPPTRYREDPEQVGGGYLNDGGPHLISELLWTTGLQAIRVTCLMDRLPSDRRAVIAIELENGALATVCSLGDSRHDGRRVRNTIGGSRGTITVEGFEFLTTVRTHDAEPVTFQENEMASVPGPVANLIDAIRGRAAVASPPEHGAHVQDVIAAAYESAANGRTVEIGR